VVELDAGTTLTQSSAATRSWLQSLRARLPDFEYSEAKYYAAFRTGPARRAFAYLNPAKRSIRLFLPLDPGDESHLRPTPSTSSWAERFPSVFRIAGDQDLSVAAGLIAKAQAGFTIDQEPAGVRVSVDPIHVEMQDMNEDVIDSAIRENRLRIGMVPTNSELALARQRRGQKRLRRLTLLNYDLRCALCDVVNPSLLVASHIAGWAAAPEARGMLSNIICLCRFHDVLFEQGYWSLADDLAVLRVRKRDSRVIRYLLNDGLRFREPHEHRPAMDFLHQHRMRCGLEIW